MLEPPTVFISYCRHDEKWKTLLVQQLNVLVRQGLIDVWDDQRIRLGADWKDTITTAIARARVAVLILTPNFLSSEFVLKKEVPQLLMRYRSEGLSIVPILIRQCAWKRVDWLEPIQIVPRSGRPLAAEPEHAIDEHLAIIVEEIYQLISEAPREEASGPRASQSQSPSLNIETLSARPFLQSSISNTEHVYAARDESRTTAQVGPAAKKSSHETADLPTENQTAASAPAKQLIRSRGLWKTLDRPFVFFGLAGALIFVWLIHSKSNATNQESETWCVGAPPDMLWGHPSGPIWTDSRRIYYRVWGVSVNYIYSALKFADSDNQAAKLKKIGASFRFEMDESNVYWVEDRHLMKLDKSGGAAQDVGFMPTNELLLDSESFYWCQKEGIMSMPKGGGKIMTRVTLNGTLSCNRNLIMDSTAFFWIHRDFDTDSLTVYTAPKVGGEGVTAVASLQGYAPEQGLAVDDASIFVATKLKSDAHRSEKCWINAFPRTGGKPLVLVDDRCADAVVSSGEWLYYADGAVYRVSKHGGVSEVVVRTSSADGDLVLDKDGIYWSSFGAVCGIARH